MDGFQIAKRNPKDANGPGVPPILRVAATVRYYVLEPQNLVNFDFRSPSGLDYALHPCFSMHHSGFAMSTRQKRDQVFYGVGGTQRLVS
ncbi:hypothetical protein SPHV1_410013 [Novosphingobium sp. KN65.2]|nr:hypothetical protein SPHV1_410013 [Novosphingobium sp. KN65.2]